MLYQSVSLIKAGWDRGRNNKYTIGQADQFNKSKSYPTVRSQAVQISRDEFTVVYRRLQKSQYDLGTCETDSHLPKEVISLPYL